MPGRGRTEQVARLTQVTPRLGPADRYGNRTVHLDGAVIPPIPPLYRVAGAEQLRDLIVSAAGRQAGPRVEQAFLLGWNDVLFASVMTNVDSRTAAVALQVFGATQEGGAIPVYGQLMAASLLCAAPVVLLYLVFQRYLVDGLTAGGVK